MEYITRRMYYALGTRGFSCACFVSGRSHCLTLWPGLFQALRWGGQGGGGEGARKTAPVTKREEITFACMAVFITPLSEHVILDVYLCCIRLRLIFPRMRVW